MIAVFLDIEATGLSYTQDKLIELGMVKFEYNRHSSIFCLLDDFSSYQDPGSPILEYITKLSGINDDMVRGHKIEENSVADYLQGVDLIIAHNAQFDRTFLETTFPSKAWDKVGISSRKLEYIAYKFGFFHEGHRATNDCLADVHLLAQKLPRSQESVLKELLTQSKAIRFKLCAVNYPYDSKELLKAQGYRWSMN
nr:DNA polymerase III PolC-type-like [Hydra vulgaris]